VLPREESRGSAQYFDGLLQLAVLSAQLAELRGLAAGDTRRLALVDSRLADPLGSVSALIPRRPATAVIAAYSDGYSPACSATSRMALALVSWLYLTGMNVTSFPR
jgi:hypothetical protein